MNAWVAPLKSLFYRCGAPLYALALERAGRDARTLADHWRIARHLGWRGFRIRPLQIESEILALLALVAERGPRRLVEIGSAEGGTFYLLTRAAPAGATLVSVDLDESRTARGAYPRWRERLLRSFARDRQVVRILRGDSQQVDMVARLQRELGGESVDFLLIDGDHRYEGVARDFELYSPLVGSGGLIAFHDIVPGSPDLVGGVPRFWAEQRARFSHRELVADWQQGGFGIGVLFVP